MEDLTELESAWSIWSGETGVDMDQAFADFSTPQQWCDAGIFPGDHELFIVQGYTPQTVQNYGFQEISTPEAMRQQSNCSRLRLFLVNVLIWALGRLAPFSAVFMLILEMGKYILSLGGDHHANRNHC